MWQVAGGPKLANLILLSANTIHYADMTDPTTIIN